MTSTLGGEPGAASDGAEPEQNLEGRRACGGDHAMAGRAIRPHVNEGRHPLGGMGAATATPDWGESGMRRTLEYRNSADNKCTRNQVVCKPLVHPLGDISGSSSDGVFRRPRTAPKRLLRRRFPVLRAAPAGSGHRAGTGCQEPARPSAACTSPAGCEWFCTPALQRRSGLRIRSTVCMDHDLYGHRRDALLRAAKERQQPR